MGDWTSYQASLLQSRSLTSLSLITVKTDAHIPTSSGQLRADLPNQPLSLLLSVFAGGRRHAQVESINALNEKVKVIIN